MEAFPAFVFFHNYMKISKPCATIWMLLWRLLQKLNVNKTLLFVQSHIIMLTDILLHTHTTSCSVCMKLWLVHFTTLGFLLFHFVVQRVCGVATSKLINHSITQYICTNFTGLSVIDRVSDCLKELCSLTCVSSVGVQSHQFYLNFVVPVHRKSNTLAHFG